jgi:hypothetical protein
MEGAGWGCLVAPHLFFWYNYMRFIINFYFMQIIALLLSLVIWGLVFWLLWWGLGKIGLAEPFNKVATVILVLASIVVVIGLLTGSVAPFPFLTGVIK